MTPRKKKVFFSYSSKDKPFVDRLAKDLRQSGVKVWEYSDGIAVGESIPTKIGEKLRDADFYAIILSPNSVTSVWVERELSAAIQIENERDSSVFIVPILYQDCARPTLIAAKRYANFVNSYQLGLHELLRAFSGQYLRYVFGESPEVKAKKIISLCERTDSLTVQTDQTISGQVPVLIRNLTINVTDRVLNDVVKPALYAWRRDELKTLNDVKSNIGQRVVAWLTDREVNERITHIVADWLEAISKNLLVSIKLIYQEFDLQFEDDKLEESTSLSLGQSVSVGDLPIEFDKTIGNIAGAVVATIVGILGLILMFVPPVGPFEAIIGVLMVTVFSMFGLGEYAKNKVNSSLQKWASDRDIPAWLREDLLSDGKILEILEQSKFKLREELERSLTETLAPKVQEQVLKSMREFISLQREKIITLLT